MKFEPLTILQNGDDTLWVAGAEHGQRTDGTSSLMIAQAYSASKDMPIGTTLVDQLGQSWVVVKDAFNGFHFDSMILEEESHYARTTE
jgi:hypothetical protein